MSSSKKSYYDDKFHHKSNDKSNCFIDQHFSNFFNIQSCNGSDQVVFEDLTDNHNKTLIIAQSFTSGPCTVILIIETRDDCRPIERILPSPVQGQPFII